MSFPSDVSNFFSDEAMAIENHDPSAIAIMIFVVIMVFVIFALSIVLVSKTLAEFTFVFSLSLEECSSKYNSVRVMNTLSD